MMSWIENNLNANFEIQKLNTKSQKLKSKKLN